MFRNLNLRIAISLAVVFGYGAMLAKAFTWPREEVGLYLMVACGLASIALSVLNQISSPSHKG